MDENNNVNIHVPYHVTAQEYLDLVSRGLLSRIRRFSPEVLFWNFGYDGTVNDYGDIGLPPETHISLAKLFKSTADELVHRRLIVVLCGGSRRDLARDLIPAIIRVLAGI